MKRLMVIGGHSGDEAISVGGIVAKVVREGGYCVFVALTNGDGGHPVLNRTQYAPQKDAEAYAAAKILGAECILWPVSSGHVAISPESEAKLATLIRTHKPDTIITHWRNSMHRDHVASYYNTVAAIGKAASPVFEDGNEPFTVENLYFFDNWEDADDFKPQLYVSIQPEDEAKWLEACKCFEFFRESFYDFDYQTYYTSLHQVRGAIAAREGAPTKLANALMLPPVTAYDPRIL